MADNGNKVRFGLSNVHIALKTADGYGTPVAIPGAVSLSCDPEGDSEKFYADNTAYYTISTNAGYTGEIEMALIPDDVKRDILGWKIDKNGALVEVDDAAPQPFALLYQVNGDTRNRHNVFYNVTAERPSDENSTTEDSASPATEKLSVTMIPADIDGAKVTKLSIEPNESNAAAIAAFYNEVYTPDFSEGESA